jgi:diguanylate cyclase (GGDEF)-like protein
MLVAAALIALVVCALVVAAAIVFVSLERGRLRDAMDEVARRQAIAAALGAIAREFVLASRESLDAVRQRLDSLLRKYFGSLDSVAIFDAEGEGLRCVYATGERLRNYVGTTLAQDSPVLPAVAKRFGHTCTLDVPATKPLHPSDAAAAAIPLALEPGTMSIVYVSCTPAPRGGWDPLESVVAAAGPSYFVASERDELIREMTHDPLTMLLNRRAFNVRLQEALDRGQEVSICYIDLDGFKGWNDTYGHHSGDLVLKQAADIFRAHVFSVHDLVTRCGGDEFAIAFVNVPKSRAIERALEIGASIIHADRSTFFIGEDQNKAVTACIGVASAEDGGFRIQHEGDRVWTEAASPAGVVAANDVVGRVDQADKLMYFSKRNGKDRVSFLLEDGEIRAICSSEYERRDPASRPALDRRGNHRPFVGNLPLPPTVPPAPAQGLLP